MWEALHAKDQNVWFIRFKEEKPLTRVHSQDEADNLVNTLNYYDRTEKDLRERLNR